MLYVVLVLLYVFVYSYVGRLLIGRRYGGEGSMYGGYILLFKVVQEILLGKLACLSLS